MVLADIANDHSFAPVYGTRSSRTRRFRSDAGLRQSKGAAGGSRSRQWRQSHADHRPEPARNAAICRRHARAYCRPAGIDVTLDVMPVDQYYGAGDNQPWLVVPFGRPTGPRGALSPKPSFRNSRRRVMELRALVQPVVRQAVRRLQRRTRSPETTALARKARAHPARGGAGHCRLLDRRAASGRQVGARSPVGARQFYRP